jgi:threonine aldolase
VQEAIDRSANGPFPIPVEVISIECPVRRMDGQAFDFQEMKNISQLAHDKAIKMHLDGARLFIASAYTGIDPLTYASLFDTVYISLYKYLGAATGAVLAGPKNTIAKVAHARKVFGGGLLHGWPYTAVAGYFLDGFLERYSKAVTTARALFTSLEKHGFRVEVVPKGTNIFRLHVPIKDTDGYRKNLSDRGILVRPAQKGVITMFVNESVNMRPAEELSKLFLEARPNT